MIARWLLLALVAAMPAQAAEPRGTGDLGIVVERETGSVLVVETTSATVLGRVEGLGDLSHASAVFGRDGRHAYVFGRDGGIAVSATKSATGHLLGAAGGLEAIFTILALRDQIAPPTRNLETADPAAEGIDLVGSTARKVAMEYAITNGFGFGGVNASALFRRWS